MCLALGWTLWAGVGAGARAEESPWGARGLLGELNNGRAVDTDLPGVPWEVQWGRMLNTGLRAGASEKKKVPSEPK